MPAAVVSTPHAPLPTGPMARTPQEVSPRSTLQTSVSDTRDSDKRNSNSTPVVVAEGPAPTPQQQPPQAQQTDASSGAKRISPNTLRPGPPKIVVKKEPTSPEHVSNKHRPRRLDLSNSTSRLAGPATAAPTLGMQDVGIACLSPGFQTQDPVMREQLQRSISVRDSQRALIESRLQKNSHPGNKSSGDRITHGEPHDVAGPGGLKNQAGKKRGPPPGLSIVAPAAHQFSHDQRAIQSAPLGATFTGRDQPPPHLQHRQPNGHPGPAGSAHAHQLQAGPPGNRLPPINDVFGGIGVSGHPRSSPTPGQPGAPPARPGLYQSHSSATLTTQQRPGPPAGAYPASPGFPPNGPPSNGPPQQSQQQQQLAPNAGPPSREREYHSAEDAIADMTQGDKERQPKYVHYGGHQPPTPPSPQPGQHGHTPTKHAGYPPGQHPQYVAPPTSASYAAAASAYPHPPASAGKRPRTEYERDNGSPPLGSGPSPRGHRGADYARQFAAGIGPFGAGRDSPATQKQRKDEFMACLSRAWDLWHS